MKEGFELKSFCVKTEELTYQEAVDMLDRCVELGASPFDGVKYAKMSYHYNSRYSLSNFKFVGINTAMDTFVSNEGYNYSEVLTKQGMLDYLGLYESGGRLLVKETTPKVGSAFMVKLLDNTELQLNITEPCKITVKGGWLEITPTSGES